MLGFTRWQIFKTSAAAALAVGTISLLLTYFIPAPPSTVTMGTGFQGSSFEYVGQRYRDIFALHAQRAIAVLVAGLAIGLPTFRFLPVFYQWVMRRRLMYWYAKLKALEASFDINENAISLPETKIEIERIEDAVGKYGKVLLGIADTKPAPRCCFRAPVPGHIAPPFSNFENLLLTPSPNAMCGLGR